MSAIAGLRLAVGLLIGFMTVTLRVDHFVTGLGFNLLASGLTLFRNGTEGFQGFTLVGDTVTLQLRGGCKNDGGTLTIYDHIKRTMAGFPEIQHVKVLGPDGTTQDLEGKGDSRPACLEP